jgi:hypothetical protein
MYSGLQPDSQEYFEPMAGGGSYQSPQNKPMKNPKTVGSPVYQEFSDNVIPSSVNNNSKQNANGNIYNSLTQNQPIKGSDTNTDATNQNYFAFNPQNEADSSKSTANKRPVNILFLKNRIVNSRPLINPRIIVKFQMKLIKLITTILF